MKNNLYVNLLGRTFRTDIISRLTSFGLAAACCIIAPQVRGAWTPPDSVIIYANFDPNFGGDPIGLSSQNSIGPSYYAGFYSERDAVAFTTDANAYELNSVSLDLSRLLGVTSDLIVSLYGDAGGAPDTSLGTFSDPALIGQGPQLFTASGLTLEPETTYWIVAEPGLLENCDFEWWHTIDTVGQENISHLDPGGSFWEPSDSITSSAQLSLAVYGTPVPEPSILALTGLGAATLMLFRWRK
jgi:hypothetical protein